MTSNDLSLDARERAKKYAKLLGTPLGKHCKLYLNKIS
jgi:hypothetical protein